MKLFSSLSFFLFLNYFFSQNPISWEIIYENSRSEILFNAVIKNGWHLYAVNVPDPNQGPLPTKFNFNENKNYSIVEKIKQENPIKEFDKEFGVKIAYYKNQTQFIQPILSTESRFKLSGAIEYMTCNEEKCLPFNYKFEILINHQD